MTLRLATSAMATRFELVLAGADEPRLRAAGEAALWEIEACDRELSRFRPSSLVSWLGARAARGPVRLGDEHFELLRACRDVWRDSGGAFDVTLAPRMRALGFWDGERNPPARRASSPLQGVEVGGGGIPRGTPPGDVRGGPGLRPEPAKPGMAAWHLDPADGSVRFDRPLELDLGAIGKGHALDRAGDVLREAGVRCALLHGGTSAVLAIGAPPGADAWRVALRAGDDEPFVVRLRDAALGVSAPTGRTVDRLPDGSAAASGAVLGHVLDPATGLPATAHRLAAVVHRSARTADAWSTALLVRDASAAGLPADATALVLPASPDHPPRVRGADPSLFEPRDAALPTSP